MKLAFEQFGKGFPIVLLHAFPFSRKMWSKQIDSIVKNNFSLIIIDLPGFGESSSSANVNTMETMANSVFETLGGLKISKAIIGGISMGGYVALNFYRLFSEIVTALILCDTTPKADTSEIRNKRFDLIRQIKIQGMKPVAVNVLPNLLSENTILNSKDLFEHLENEILNTDIQGTIAALDGMAERIDHTSLLETIKIPTLLIFGEDDKITDISMAKNIKELLPNSQLKIIKNCGHLSNLEQPEAFNKILIEFLTSLNLKH